MYQTIGKLISKARIEKCGDREFPVLSMTMHDGIMFQGDRFKKQIASVDQSTYNVVKRNQLVVSFPIDEGVLAVQDITDAGIVSPAYKIWDIDQESVVPKYLELFLRSPHSIQYYKSKLRGTTARRRSITDADLLDMEIPLPSIERQGCIIEIINKVKQIQNVYKEKLDLLDELIKARFVEMFGDPIDNNEKLCIKPFSDCCVDMHQGINTVADKVDYQLEGYPIIQSKNITKGYLDLEDARYLSQADYDKYHEKYNPQVNDLLICNIGTIGKSYIITTPQSFLIAWNLFLVKLDLNVINSIYAKVFIEMLNEKKYFDRFLTGGTVKFVNKKTMGAIPTPIPAMELQEEFAGFVKQIDKSKVEVQKALDKTRVLFDSLMQEYFG